MVVKTLKNFSVPEERNRLFTRPAFKNWPSVLGKNKNALSVVNKRDTSRNELVNIAARYTKMLGLPVADLKGTAELIVTGHQPNWHHCGIFAKTIVADKFAGQINGTAIQLVLEHDICNTSMPVPAAGDDGVVKLETIPLERKRQNIPLEFRFVPAGEQLIKFVNTASRACENSFCSNLWEADVSKIIDSSWSCRNIADIITQLQARLSAALGIEVIYLPVSLISQSDSFFRFVSTVISDAARFGSVYNRAIKNKRLSENLKQSETVRPLKIDYLNNVIELPFWLLRKTGKRSSLYVSIDDKNIRLGTSDTTIGTIDSSKNKKQQLRQILKKNNCSIRPKAVTLTLFTRLHLADLFVHGTGAVNYEYITDHLIKNHYKISNVNFGVATATMTLPAGGNYREFFFGLFPEDRLKRLIGFQRNRK